MAVPKKRQEWIKQLARGEAPELDALLDIDDVHRQNEAFDRVYRKFFASVKDAVELHVFAESDCWDGGVDGLQHVIRHPLCDLGTALLVYWNGQPDFYLQYANRKSVPDHARETWDLLREIEKRVESGEYRTAAQPFDPANHAGNDRRPKPSQIKRYKRDLPAVMYRAVPYPKANPRWLTSAVVSLVQAIRRESAFDRLPILGDALEEAGCSNEEILAACRKNGPWVVHLLELLRDGKPRRKRGASRQ